MTDDAVSTADPLTPCHACGQPFPDRHTCKHAWRTLARGRGVYVNGLWVIGDEHADDIVWHNGRNVRVYSWEVWLRHRRQGIFSTKREAYQFAKAA